MFTATALDIARTNLVRQAMALIRTRNGDSGKPATRWGDRKVFIAAVWDSLPAQACLSTDASAIFATFATYVEWLMRAMRTDDGSGNALVEMARADLVSAMDPIAVSASELTDRGACWHFLIDPGAEEDELHLLVDHPRAPGVWRTMRVSRTGR